MDCLLCETSDSSQTALFPARLLTHTHSDHVCCHLGSWLSSVLGHIDLTFDFWSSSPCTLTECLCWIWTSCISAETNQLCWQSAAVKDLRLLLNCFHNMKVLGSNPGLHLLLLNLCGFSMDFPSSSHSPSIWRPGWMDTEWKLPVGANVAARDWSSFGNRFPVQAEPNPHPVSDWLNGTPRCQPLERVQGCFIIFMG